MASSKPLPLPYSSYYATFRIYNESVLYNYAHRDVIRLADLDFFGIEKPPNFMLRLTGNYSPAAYQKLLEEQQVKTPDKMNWTSMLRHLDVDLTILERYGDQPAEEFRFASAYPGGTPETIKKLYIDQQKREISKFINHVTRPMLNRLNAINLELYESHTFEKFKAELVSCTLFDRLAKQFFDGFFCFCCYSQPSERAAILELAIGHGKRLLPTLPKYAFGEPDASTCLWIAIQYFDLAKKTAFNWRYKCIRIPSHSDPDSHWVATWSLRKFMAERIRQPRAKYACDFIRKNGACTQIVQARLCDVLVHMTPLFELSYECATALACGLHPRLGKRTRQIKLPKPWRESYGRSREVLVRETKLDTMEITCVSPLARLDSDLLKMIWSYARPSFASKSKPMPRARPKRGPKA